MEQSNTTFKNIVIHTKYDEKEIELNDSTYKFDIDTSLYIIENSSNKIVIPYNNVAYLEIIK